MAISNVDICDWAYEGKLQFLKTAVEGNPRKLTETDSSKRTALHWACSSGKADVVSFLIAKGAEV